MNLTPRKQIIILFLFSAIISFSLPVIAQRLENIYPPLPESLQERINIVTPISTRTPLPDFFRYVFVMGIIFGGIIILVSLVIAGIRFYLAAIKGEGAQLAQAKGRIFDVIIGALLILGSVALLNSIEPQILINQVAISSRTGIILWNVPDCNDLDPEAERRFVLFEDQSSFFTDKKGNVYEAKSFKVPADTPIKEIIFYTKENFKGEELKVDGRGIQPGECKNIEFENNPDRGARSIRIRWQLPGLYICTGPYRIKATTYDPTTGRAISRWYPSIENGGIGKLMVIKRTDGSIVWDPLKDGYYVDNFKIENVSYEWYCTGKEYYLGSSSQKLPDELNDKIGGVRFVPEIKTLAVIDVPRTLIHESYTGGPETPEQFFKRECQRIGGEVVKKENKDYCRLYWKEYTSYGAIFFEHDLYKGRCVINPGIDIAYYLPFGYDSITLEQVIDGLRGYINARYELNTRESGDRGVDIAVSYMYNFLKDIAPAVMTGRYPGISLGTGIDPETQQSFQYLPAPFSSVYIFKTRRLQFPSSFLIEKITPYLKGKATAPQTLLNYKEFVRNSIKDIFEVIIAKEQEPENPTTETDNSRTIFACGKSQVFEKWAGSREEVPIINVYEKTPDGQERYPLAEELENFWCNLHNIAVSQRYGITEGLANGAVFCNVPAGPDLDIYNQEDFSNYCIGPYSEYRAVENLETATIWNISPINNFEKIPAKQGGNFNDNIYSVFLLPEDNYITVLFDGGEYKASCQLLTKTTPDLTIYPIGRCGQDIVLGAGRTIMRFFGKTTSCVSSAVVIKVTP